MLKVGQLASYRARNTHRPYNRHLPLQYGTITQRKVAAMVELLDSFDQIADVARFMGLIVCSGCFYTAVCIYFYQKLLNSPFGEFYGATPAGIVVVGIMTMGAIACLCVFVCMTCRNCRINII